MTDSTSVGSSVGKTTTTKKKWQKTCYIENYSAQCTVTFSKVMSMKLEDGRCMCKMTACNLSMASYCSQFYRSDIALQ